MLQRFNDFLQKRMAFVTPTCMIVGILFSDYTRYGIPYVSYVFAVMTFIGALKSSFKDVKNVFRHPLPLITVFVLLHVVLPSAAWGAGHLFFSSNPNLITGMVLEFSVPAAVVGLMWVSIYNGNNTLALALVVVDTVLAPFVIPTTLRILVGANVQMDTTGMMKDLIFMIASCNEPESDQWWESEGNMAAEACTMVKNLYDLCSYIQFFQSGAVCEAYDISESMYSIDDPCACSDSLCAWMGRSTVDEAETGECHFHGIWIGTSQY